MTFTGDISATTSLSVLAAVILISCCFYYLISRKQRQREEPKSTKKLKRWFPRVCSPFEPQVNDDTSSRSESVCSQQTLNLGDLMRAMEAQDELQRMKEPRRGSCSGENRVIRYTSILMPGSSSIQEKQERFHRWLFTPVFHLTPIKEEVIIIPNNNNNNDLHTNAEARTPEINACKNCPLAQELVIPVVITISPKTDSLESERIENIV